MSGLEDLLVAFGQKSKSLRGFSEDVLGVRVNPAQARWDGLIERMEDHSWYYREVIHRAANQVGKTLGVAIADLWAAHNKMGVPPGDAKYRLGVPYKWLHLAPNFPTSRKMLEDDMIPLLEGRHPAQFDKEKGQFRPCLFPREAWERVNFEGEYPGIRLWNGAEIHFRTMDEKAKGVSQLVANGISVDEAGLEPHLKDTRDTTLRMRVVANNGPIWYIGTPDGPNDFAEMIWDIEASGSEVENRVWIDDVQRRALAWSIFDDNVGFGVTQAEADYQEATQDPATKEAKLRGAILFPQKAFFTPAENILRSWVPGLKSKEYPQAGHKYVIFWDVSVQSDPTVMIVLDVTRKPWRGVKFRRWIKPMPVQELIDAMEAEAYHWSQAAPNMLAPVVRTGYDSTAMGGSIFTQLMKNVPNKIGMNLGGSAKMKLQALADLRAKMSRLELLWPEDWLTLRKEVMGYRLEDKKIRQDCVMTAAGCVWVAKMGDMTMRARPFDTGYREGLSVG
jgi:hypothetical protein